MDIFDSVDIDNRIKLRTIIVAATIYVTLAVFTLGVALIPVMLIWLIAIGISNKEIRSVSESATEFKKSYPFRYFGSSYGEFTHVFQHADGLEAKLLEAIETDLRAKTPVSDLRQITITDIDRDLRRPESRTFKIAESPTTTRGTTVTLLLRFAFFGSMQTIQWWVLGGGYVDRDKRFNFVAYAPVTIWFWILPYLRRDYDLLPKIRTVYSSTYNYFDLETQIRCLHEAVFTALIDELERNGVDTSDLKVQRMQAMNINISGGSVNMGNIVQGSMNKVIASTKGVGKQ